MIRVPLVIPSGQTNGTWKDMRKALGEQGVNIDTLEANCICGVETPNGTFEPTELTVQCAQPDPADDTVQDDAAIKDVDADPIAVSAAKVVPISMQTYSMLYPFMRVKANSAPAANRTVYLLLRRVT